MPGTCFLKLVTGEDARSRRLHVRLPAPSLSVRLFRGFTRWPDSFSTGGLVSHGADLTSIETSGDRDKKETQPARRQHRLSPFVAREE